ncbi:hypothetical protein [Amycolatopsis sp. cmx-4-54]|uniref:hypothetical protein n=1 Tax=Amycolatopsis sp. cmx-4-54 TaxID=2790936 RepID=UPI00397E61D5
MDLDDFFSIEIAEMSTENDEVTARRLAAQALARYESLLRDPGRLAEVDIELESLEAAEEAFRAGVEAERLGDYTTAADVYTVAAEASLGDAPLRLARCLVELGRHADALPWCSVAEEEGLDEAADLAVRCHSALGQEPPVRQTEAKKSHPFKEGSEPASGPPRSTADSADPGLTRRLKALACTAPLHDLDNRKVMFDWLDPAAYQMAEIALHVIDLVTISMDFDKGAGHDEIIGRVVPFVANQAPQRNTKEHERVARWVLERLINVGTVDRTFYQVYGEIDIEGRYRRQPFYYKIVQEVPGPRGSLSLRTSNEAITVLIGALDTDVESAQIAAEVKLQNLIERGKLADARSAAEQARYRTVQYGEDLRKRLEATRRDLRLVDWQEELPAMLDGALGHIEERIRVEQTIHASITEARDTTDEPVRKFHAAELVIVVEDCLHRHVQLQARLQGARSVFRQEQDRQQFSGPPRRSAINLHGQLLEPVLNLSVKAAGGPLTAFFRCAVGPTVPEVTTLSDLISALLRPSIEPQRTAGPVVHPAPADPIDDSRFTEEHWRLADALLDLPGQVRRLSELVDDAAEHDDDLPVLVALRAGNALAPAVETARTKRKHRILMSVPADMTFSGPRATASGDDLLVTSADLKDPATAEPVSTGEPA